MFAVLQSLGDDQPVASRAIHGDFAHLGGHVRLDQPKKLGNNETGGSAALPIWINYMSKALAGVPEVPISAPEGVVSARINEAGIQTADGKLSDFFFKESIPTAEAGAAGALDIKTAGF